MLLPYQATFHMTLMDYLQAGTGTYDIHTTGIRYQY
jgi:hypothetical protein